MILAQSPSPEVSALPTLSPDSSLSELRKIKAGWLATASELGYIDDARTVARYLGQPFDVPGRVLWQAWRWQDGDLTLELYQGQTHYLPEEEAFNRVTTLVATVGARRVCYHRESDDPREEADNFFIWGKWTNQVLLCRAEALERARVQGLDTTERERQELLDQLLVGLEV